MVVATEKEYSLFSDLSDRTSGLTDQYSIVLSDRKKKRHTQILLKEYYREVKVNSGRGFKNTFMGE